MHGQNIFTENILTQKSQHDVTQSKICICVCVLNKNPLPHCMLGFLTKGLLELSCTSTGKLMGAGSSERKWRQKDGINAAVQ